MRSSLSSRTLAFAGVAELALATVVGVLLMSIPPVVGLGDRVKLPLLHGGSTWVDLLLFTLMGVVGLVYLVGRNDRIYAWEVGLRTVAAPLWFVNSVLGFIAASSTWDFTASKESPLAVIPTDPRLSAQVILLAAVIVVILADWLVLEKAIYKATADVVFVVVMWALMANVFLDPVKRAMHPDSPVMNSGMEIKGPFFGMVAAVLVFMLIASWVAASFVKPTSGDAASSTSESPSAESPSAHEA
jgi:hypothetical protein